LHAPWRIEYILAPKPAESLFARIAQSNEDEANYVVARARTCYALLNSYPYTGGHLLVARLQHIGERVALSAPAKFLLAMAVIISLVSIPLLTRAQESNDKRTLTGNWMVTVTPTPPPQAPVFLTLVTYFADGNLLQEGTNPNIRSTGRGNWERTGHQQFTQSFIFFRFDAARNYLGTVRPTSTITLSEDGSELQGDTVAQIYDASGNLLRTVQLSEVGQRF